MVTRLSADCYEITGRLFEVEAGVWGLADGHGLARHCRLRPRDGADCSVHRSSTVAASPLAVLPRLTPGQIETKPQTKSNPTQIKWE